MTTFIEFTSKDGDHLLVQISKITLIGFTAAGAVLVQAEGMLNPVTVRESYLAIRDKLPDVVFPGTGAFETKAAKKTGLRKKAN